MVYPLGSIVEFCNFDENSYWYFLNGQQTATLSLLLPADVFEGGVPGVGYKVDNDEVCGYLIPPRNLRFRKLPAKEEKWAADKVNDILRDLTILETA